MAVGTAYYSAKSPPFVGPLDFQLVHLTLQILNGFLCLANTGVTIFLLSPATDVRLFLLDTALLGCHLLADAARFLRWI